MVGNWGTGHGLLRYVLQVVLNLRNSSARAGSSALTSPLRQTDRCGRRFLEAGDHRGQDWSRHADQFGYARALGVRQPDVARAVDRHKFWSIEARPGRGKVAEQGPVVVKRGYGFATKVRHPDAARAVDRHAEWSIEVRPGRGKVVRYESDEGKLGYGIVAAVRHPDARAVDRHAAWVAELRRGGVKGVDQGPVVLKRGYGFVTAPSSSTTYTIRGRDYLAIFLSSLAEGIRRLFKSGNVYRRNQTRVR